MTTDTLSKNRCGHENCKCFTAPESRYCSESCERDAAIGSGRLLVCSCAHPMCGEPIET